MNRINIWIALLLASVLLNGVLIGASAHRWFNDEGTPGASIREQADDAASVKGFEPRSFFSAVPEEYRNELFEQMAASRDEIYALMRDLREKRRVVRDVLTSEPFDSEAAAQALSEARDARALLEQRTESLILDAAETLPADVRREAFERALTRLDPRREPDERDGHPRHPPGPPPGAAPPDHF